VLSLLIGPHGSNLHWISRISGCRVNITGRGTAAAAANPQDDASALDPHFQISDFGPQGPSVAIHACNTLLRDISSFCKCARRAGTKLTELRRLHKFAAWFSGSSEVEHENRREEIIADLKNGRGLSDMAICQGVSELDGACSTSPSPVDAHTEGWESEESATEKDQVPGLGLALSMQSGGEACDCGDSQSEHETTPSD